MSNIYIGWDSREDIAYQVAKYSIERYNSQVQVRALRQHELRDRNLYWRLPDLLASTEFTFTRFLVPYLNNYQGWAIFADCDFLFRCDVQEIFDQADPRYAVMVAKHNYTPNNGSIKMDGKTQHAYPRKNWSSMMLFNCAHPSNQALSLENVNSQSGAWLHRFQWLNDSEIGEISHEYNWLVGWYNEPSDGRPSVLHYTEGAPFMPGYEKCDYAQDWFAIRDEYYQSW